MKKSTIAFVFAALSVAAYGCKKDTDTANPDEGTKTETPAGDTAGTPPAGDTAGDATTPPAGDTAGGEEKPADPPAA